MDRWRTFGIACLTVLLVGSAVLGAELRSAATAPSKGEAVRPAAECPLLFGHPSSLGKNRATRNASLDSVRSGEHVINLIYTGKWMRPEKIHYRGLLLVETLDALQSEPRALVRIGDLPAGLDCQPGLYSLRVDHSIGGQGRVLAILDDVVLLEHADRLRFLKVVRADEPVFRMIWRSRWTVAGSSPSASTPSRPSSSAARSRTRPPRPPKSPVHHRKSVR